MNRASRGDSFLGGIGTAADARAETGQGSFACLVALESHETEAIAAAMRCGGTVIVAPGPGGGALRFQDMLDSLTARLAPDPLVPEHLILRARSVAEASDLAEALDVRGDRLRIVVACDDADQIPAIQDLAGRVPLLVESGSPAVLGQLALIDALLGLVAVGEEAGGWTGARRSRFPATARFGGPKDAASAVLLRGAPLTRRTGRSRTARCHPPGAASAARRGRGRPRGADLPAARPPMHRGHPASPTRRLQDRPSGRKSGGNERDAT